MPANAGYNADGAAAPPPIVFDGDFLPATFKTQSLEIARDAVRYVARGDDYSLAPSKMCTVMRNLVDDTLKTSADMMANMVRVLDVRNREQLGLLTSIANEMFEDQQVNWGRIVTLHTFCGCLARYCERNNIPDCADDVATILADFVVNRLGLWIVTHGGWKSFESQMPTMCMWANAGVLKGLAILVLFAGVMFAFYSSVRFFSS